MRVSSCRDGDDDGGTRIRAAVLQMKKGVRKEEEKSPLLLRESSSPSWRLRV
jgi:hypothetical protein